MEMVTMGPHSRKCNHIPPRFYVEIGYYNKCAFQQYIEHSQFGSTSIPKRSLKMTNLALVSMGAAINTVLPLESANQRWFNLCIVHLKSQKWQLGVLVAMETRQNVPIKQHLFFLIGITLPIISECLVIYFCFLADGYGG